MVQGEVRGQQQVRGRVNSYTYSRELALNIEVDERAGW